MVTDISEEYLTLSSGINRKEKACYILGIAFQPKSYPKGIMGRCEFKWKKGAKFYLECRNQLSQPLQQMSNVVEKTEEEKL